MVRDASKGAVKLVDFSMSCIHPQCNVNYSGSLPKCYGKDFGSYHYGAPEVFFGMPYAFPIDMFAFGLIVADFRTGSRHLFTGQSKPEVVAGMMEILGMPPKFMLDPSLATWADKYFGELLLNQDYK